jgi:hypothetical protein
MRTTSVWLCRGVATTEQSDMTTSRGRPNDGSTFSMVDRMAGHSTDFTVSSVTPVLGATGVDTVIVY